MSFTREDYVKLWNLVKSMENEVTGNLHIRQLTREIILGHLKKMKDLIQSVIGQME